MHKEKEGNLIGRNIFILIVMFFLLKDAHSQQNIYTFNLKEAISWALENNKRLLSFKEKIKIAYAQIKENSSRLYPRLDLKGAINYTKFLEKRKYEIAIKKIEGEKFSQIIEEKPYNTYLGIHLSQTLFDHGKTIAEIKMAEENLKEIEVEYELLKQEVISEVAEAYYNLVKIKEKKKVYQEEKERAEFLYHITSAKLEEGLIPQISLKRAKLNIWEAEGKLNTAKSDEDLAQEYLKRLLGLSPLSLITIKDELPQFSPIEVNLDEVISKALNNRLEIKRQQINLNKERLSKKIAQSLYWPNVTLDGNYTWEGRNKTPQKESF